MGHGKVRHWQGHFFGRWQQRKPDFVFKRRRAAPADRPTSRRRCCLCPGIGTMVDKCACGSRSASTTDLAKPCASKALAKFLTVVVLPTAAFGSGQRPASRVCLFLHQADVVIGHSERSGSAARQRCHQCAPAQRSPVWCWILQIARCSSIWLCKGYSRYFPHAIHDQADGGIIHPP